MALIGNYSVLQKSCANFTNGTSTAGAYAATTPSNYAKNGLFLNAFSTFNSTSSYPTGYRPPFTYRLPLKDGAISSFTISTGTISATANLSGGINLVAPGTVTISVSNAQLDQIVSAVANGTMTLAAASAILAGAAALDGSGTLQISVTASNIGAIFSVTATTSGTIANAASTLTALGHMEAEAGGPAELSPEALAAAILNALLVDYNEPGSVGEALNNVGAGGNPWDSLLIDNQNPGSFGERIQKLLTIAKFLGLK